MIKLFHPCRPQCGMAECVEIKVLPDFTFGRYAVNQNNQLAYHKATHFLDSTASLYIHGSPGNGKTHLLMATYAEALKTMCPHRVGCYNVPRLLKIDREPFETREEAEERLIDKLSRKRIIFLDDFCSEYITGRTAEIIYLLFNEAVEKKKMRLFITGNKGIRYISESISDRIASRIVGLCSFENIVKLDDVDRRIGGSHGN